MSWSRLFKHHQTGSPFQQPLLNETELQVLRDQASRLDSSSSLPYALNFHNTGWLPTQSLGSGMDYAESRVYQAGDDPRYIHWRLSARSQETFVKTYHTESRPCACILLDRRRPMIFGTRTRLKITQALRVAALLRFAVESHHIDLQPLILESDIEWLDKDAFITQGNKPCNPASQTSTANLQSALSEIQQRIPKGSLIYLISDFSDLDHSSQLELAKLQESCFVEAIDIVDRAELGFPDSIKMRLRDMQSDEVFVLDSSRKKEKKLLIDYLQRNCEEKKELISDLGISYRRVFTDEEDLYQHLTLPLAHS